MKAESGPPHEAVSSDPTPVQPIRILVVEDNLINQKVIVQQLQSLGYEAVVAPNGQAAIDITEATYYPIILMDCRLPRVDGYTATRVIRAREQRSNQPKAIIIALTASDDPQTQEAASLAGMDDFLVKPLRREILATTIDRWQRAIATSNFSPAASVLEATSQFTPAGLPVLQLEPLLDFDRLSQLADRNWDFAQELLQLYLEDTQIQVQELQQAIEQSDQEQITQLAHHLKGASANIGAYKIEQLVHQIEQAFQQPGQLTLLQAQLLEAFSQMQTLLTPYLAEE